MTIDDIISDAAAGKLPLFYEYSHFSTRVGAMILDCALGDVSGTAPEFGVPVSIDTLEERMQTLRETWSRPNK